MFLPTSLMPVIKFQPKTDAEVCRAFWSKAQKQDDHQDVFYGMITAGLSEPVPKPGKGDWLREHEEKGQTLRQFENCSFRIEPHGHCDTILLQVMLLFKMSGVNRDGYSCSRMFTIHSPPPPRHTHTPLLRSPDTNTQGSAANSTRLSVGLATQRSWDRSPDRACLEAGGGSRASRASCLGKSPNE